MTKPKRHKIIITTTDDQFNPKVLHDIHLSWKARGLLSFLLSFPRDTDFTISELTNLTVEGRDSVKAGIRELIQAGYIKPTEAKRRHGGIEYRVYGERE